MTDRQPPVPVRDAATVVLLRDTGFGPEVFLQRRVSTMEFAAGMMVFPGGAHDPQDVDLLATAVREVEEETGVRLDRTVLLPWARWVTPLGEVRRYDTLFFVAPCPGDQEPMPRGGEMDQVVWLRPAEALARFERRELQLLPPTSVTLREIGALESVADVLRAATTRQVTPIQPTIFRDDAGIGVVLPDGEVFRP